MTDKNHRLHRLIVLCMMFLFLPAVLFGAGNTPRKVVRVAYQEFNRQMIVDEHNRPVGGYAYDASLGAHTFELIDNNGLVSYLRYDPEENAFTDCYYADYRSYAYNAVRGRYLREITSRGASPRTVEARWFQLERALSFP